MTVCDLISYIIGNALLILLAALAGYARGQSSTLNKRMEAYEQGKRDGYWDAWRNDPEGVKPQEGINTITVHMNMPKEAH